MDTFTYANGSELVRNGLLKNLLWRPRAIRDAATDPARGGPGDMEGLHLDPSANSASGGNFLLSLNDGKVIGDARLVATRNDEVIGQLQSLHGIADPAKHWTVHQRKLRWTTRIEGTSFLLGVGAGENYYHWLFDCLPRLWFLEQAGRDWNQIDHFLFNSVSSPFQLQTLDALGIPEHKRVFCSKNQVLECEHLLVPPMPHEDPSRVPTWACEFLRQRFLRSARPQQAQRLLYLSRRTAGKRRLSNEALIEQIAVSRGFEVICADSLPFEEQVSKFSDARAIIGPHGAAFANIVFAPRGARVLEFFHPSHQIENYRVLSHNLGFSYHGIVGTGGEGEAFSEKLRPYEVSIHEIEKSLGDWAL